MHEDDFSQCATKSSQAWGCSDIRHNSVIRAWGRQCASPNTNDGSNPFNGANYCEIFGIAKAHPW